MNPAFNCFSLVECCAAAKIAISLPIDGTTCFLFFSVAIPGDAVSAH